MAEDFSPDEGTGADLEDVAPPRGMPRPMTAPGNRAGRPYRPYQPAPATAPSYNRPPPANPPPTGTGPQPGRREVPAPESRPRAKDSSDDSDTGEPRRSGGKRSRDDASY